MFLGEPQFEAEKYFLCINIDRTAICTFSTFESTHVFHLGPLSLFVIFFLSSFTEDENDNADDKDEASMAPRPSQTSPEDITAARRHDSRLKDFEQALDESVANDDEFLQMVRENRTRLSRDTKEWTDEYSLDDGSISSMAQRLMEVSVFVRRRFWYTHWRPQLERVYQKRLERSRKGVP